MANLSVYRGESLFVARGKPQRVRNYAGWYNDMELEFELWANLLV